MDLRDQQNKEDDTFESTVLEAVECLQPGSSQDPCFESVTDFIDESALSTGSTRRNFSRLNSTSSLIHEIRASTVVPEDVAVRTELLSVGETSEVLQETIRKTHVHRGADHSETVEVLQVRQFDFVINSKDDSLLSQPYRRIFLNQDSMALKPLISKLPAPPISYRRLTLV